MKYFSLTLAILNIVMFGLYLLDTSRVETYQWIVTPLYAIFFTYNYIVERNKTKQMIIYMMETIALMANGDPQFKVITPTRVGETERGKYLVYENKNEIDERIKQ